MKQAKGKVFLFFIIAFISLQFFYSLSAETPKDYDDWILHRDYLKQQIEQDSNKYPHGGERLKADCGPYIEAMEVFAKHRDEALRLAQEAQASPDPKVKALFDDFMDLVDRAQDEGDRSLHIADIMLRVEDRHGPIPCATLALRADLYGKCVYDNVKRLKFDPTITRDQVDRMLEKGLDDLEKGWTMEFGWFWPDAEHNPNPHVAEMLRDCNMVREVAPYFELEKHRLRAYNLMNQYLKDAVCIVPDKGHAYYLELAKQYGLAEAITYIEGFYATVYGKVEVETNGKKEPAPNAVVTITDPHDGKTWQATADSAGRYEIKAAILHEKCSPFTITAQHEGDTVEAQYKGTLAEPDPQARLTKDLVIKRKNFEIEVERSWSQASVGEFIPRAMPKNTDFSYVCKGTIPVRVKKSATDPTKFELEGGGTIIGKFTATATNTKATCTWTFETTDTFEIGGWFDPKTDPPMLYIQGQHSFTQGDTLIECTSGPPPMSLKTSQAKGPEKWGVGLKAHEGYSFDLSMYGVTYKVTLHIK